MRIYDKIAIVLFLIILIIQFTLPISKVGDETVTALTENLNYYKVHWSFNYLLFVLAFLLLGGILFLFSITERYRKYYFYSSVFWFLGVIVIFIIMIKRESLLQSNLTPELNDFPIATVITISLLIILALVQLIGEYYFSKNKKEREYFNRFLPFKVPTKYNLLFFALFITLIVLGGTLFGVIGGIVGASIAYFTAYLFNRRNKLQKKK